MKTASGTDRYATPAVWLHWAVAALIVVAFPLGVTMHELPLSPRKLELYAYHKWLGITVLALVLVRLAVRARHAPPPTLPAPAWQQRAAGLTHVALYGLMLLVPLSGWLMSSAKGFTVVYLGVLPLPDLVGKDRALGEWQTEVHEVMNFTLLGLVALHVAAALKHHLWDRDATLRRMAPSLRHSGD